MTHVIKIASYSAVNKETIALPNAPIDKSMGQIANLCHQFGLNTYMDAVQYVGKLPYGRTSNRADYSLVLSEERGACSGKHAFLAALAQELGLKIDLVLGIFEMTETNTPLVRKILKSAGLTSVPEAHCYLKFESSRFDVTFSLIPQLPRFNFLAEKVIRPCDIGDYKINFHRDFLKYWLNSSDTSEIEYIWKIRERCIEALACPNQLP